MMGPLISARQRERVLGYIETGRRRGRHGRAAAAASPRTCRSGYFVEPTVLVDVDPDATVAQEEIFGPVLVVLALRRRRRRGGASPTTRPTACRARSSARRPSGRRPSPARIRTGTVSVNGGLWYGPDVPFGGYKQSGIGREMGRAGFEEYLEIKSIADPPEQEKS